MKKMGRLCQFVQPVLMAGLTSSVLATSLVAQASRHAASVDALYQHRFFFHREEIVVITDATTEGVLTWLVNDDDSVRILALDVPPLPSGVRERLEVVGTFYDVGRLNETDSRLSGLPIGQISEQLLRKRWPGIGELPLIIATSSGPARDSDTATLRSIVLEPERYLGAGVTVTGRFRGRNLYGDMPEAPEESRWDFVLRSADASVWVVGMEPKGDDFELNVMARVDTNKWLEVTGSVRREDGMILIEAGTVSLATPVTDRVRPTATETRLLPAPEVIFSTPLPEDIDVPQDSTVRVQFSRDMDEESFENRVRVRYTGAAPPGSDDSGEIVFELSYRRRNRVLEIRFDEELERFRNVHFELLDGITASDGSPLPPWVLSFFVGG